MSDAPDNMISDLRHRLRISGTHFDGEISDLVAAAQADLMLGGILSVRAMDEGDPLVRRAITCYVKAEFGLDNPDADKFRAAYKLIREHLMLSQEYTSTEV